MSDADADEEELLARMRERMDTERSGDLMETLDAAAAEGAGRDPLLKSPQKKNVASAHGDFDTDYAEMERQQEEWSTAQQATAPPPIEGSEPPPSEGTGSPGGAARRYANSMKRPGGQSTTDFHPVEGHEPHTVFGTSGRFGERDEQIGKSKENRTLGAGVSSIQEVTGVDAWLSKRGPPSSSPVPEEEQPPAEVSSRNISRSLNSSRGGSKELYKPKPMERHPADPHVYAASFGNTTGRGDLFALEKHARHGSVHQRSHQEEFDAVYKPDRPGPGWSNVRWSTETSQMLDGAQSGRAHQRDLYGQTDEDKEAQRKRMEQAQREYEEQRRVKNTPRWETDKKWKTQIKGVPAPEEPAPRRGPPTVQLSPKMAFGKREDGQSSPFLSKPREDLYHHHTSGSPRPGQLHTSDANATHPLRGDDADPSAGNSEHAKVRRSFKAAVHTVEGAESMLEHEIRTFDGDSQVVHVAKAKWGAALTGAEGTKAAKELKKALGYEPKDKGSNRETSGANATINRSTCKTKHVAEAKKVKAIRWVSEDHDECFDRTSVHHPEHLKRVLHGTSAEAQRRVVAALQHESNPSKGSVVSTLVNRSGKVARKNKQLGGAQPRWWTRGQGYYDVRKRCGYVPGGYGDDQENTGRGGEPEPSHSHANGAGSSSRPVSSPASASAETEQRQSRRQAYVDPAGAGAGGGGGGGEVESDESDASWEGAVDQAVSAAAPAAPAAYPCCGQNRRLLVRY